MVSRDGDESTESASSEPVHSSYTEDVDGDGVRLNAFDLESIGLKTIIYHLWGISVII